MYRDILMYLALKKDVIITLNVMGSVFKSFFSKNLFFLALLNLYSKICILIKQNIYQKDIVQSRACECNPHFVRGHGRSAHD
jgi:hypothetical protein